MASSKMNLIVIGASSGGYAVIRQLTAGLPETLDAAVLIVWHMAPDFRSSFPEIINRMSPLHAAYPKDNENITVRRIYVAPPDHHMLIEDGKIRLSKGPKENRFRPAIDPLFRSAAFTHGSRVIGVILSGALDDGSAGIWAIKQCGGQAVVQDPAEAEVPSMPQNALHAVAADHITTVGEMPALLTRLVSEAPNRPEQKEVMNNIMQLSGNGKSPGSEDRAEAILPEGELSPYTCPDCNGVLAVIREGALLRFRCHTGHAFSADTLLAAVTEQVENSIWSTVRHIKESVFLLNHMGDHFAAVNQPQVAAAFFQKAKEAQMCAEDVCKTLEHHEPLTTESIRQQAEDVDRLNEKNYNE